MRNRTARGFEVRLTDGSGGTADALAGRLAVAFSYRVVPKRRPVEAARAAQAPADTHQPSIPVTQGAPTLPTQPASH